MSNSFESNFTRHLLRRFLNKFEARRTFTKMVDTQTFQGEFNPASGDNVDIKRPTDAKTSRTSDGDISGQTPGDLITGKATATVQDYFTTDVEIKESDQSLKADQLDELLEPYVDRIVTDFETDFAAFMMKNSGLSIGTPGTAVTTWQGVADAGALMTSMGIPSGEWCYALNPFGMAKLADVQRSLGAGGVAGGAVMSALEQATVVERFGGFSRVLSSDTLASFTTTAITDRAGTLSANPDVTYLTAKDTMKQTLAVTGFTANLEVQAGEIIEITGRFRINLATKKIFTDETGAKLKFRAVVTAPVTLDGSGAGNLVVSGPAIFESDGAYNTVDSAPVSGDVVTLLGAASTTYQPNLFWHKNAFAIASVPLERLNSTDTLAKTSDGLVVRCSKYSEVRANLQGYRFDFRPAYGVMNPFLSGHGFG